MKRRIIPLLVLCVIGSLLLSFSVQAAVTHRGGVTPDNLPWNRNPSRQVTYDFSTVNTKETSTTGTALAKLALVIGISDYSGTSSDLNYCDDDAYEVYNTLVNVYGFPSNNIVLLIDSDATDANIRAGIDWLISNSGPDSIVVFAYSGHGSRSNTDVDGDGERADECIIPWELSRIWDGELANLFSQLTSNKVWISFDSCYAGGMNDPGITGPGKVVTMACAENELSYESSSIENGYYTYLMVELGMRQGKADANADGIVTVEEAFTYCKNEMPKYNRRQKPQMSDGVSGDLQL